MQTMKLSPRTITVLKNFASTNPDLVIRPGSVLKTVEEHKSILITAEVPDVFENKFAIAGLSKFLGMLGLFKDPTLEIHEKKTVIVEGRRRVSFTHAAENTIVQPPEKDITLPSAEVRFSMPKDILSELLKAAGLLSMPEIAIIVEDGKVYLRTLKSEDPTSDHYTIEVPEVALAQGSGKFVIKTEQFGRLMLLDYTVELSERMFAMFYGEGIKYLVAVESSSSKYTK